MRHHDGSGFIGIFNLVHALTHMRHDELGALLRATGRTLWKQVVPGIHLDAERAQYAAQRDVMAFDGFLQLAEFFFGYVVPHVLGAGFEAVESITDLPR